MEGLEVIEKSYKNLKNFKEIIMSSSFSSATQLVITITNYDMETQSGIKKAIGDILEVYKDELDLDKPIIKILTGNTITIKIPDKVDGFIDDLIDSLRNYIDPRCASLWNIITNSNSTGGLYSV